MTIMLMVAALTSFTSIESVSVYGKTRLRWGTPAYEGVYIHRSSWGGGSYSLGTDIVEYLISAFGKTGIVAPRAWHYTLYRDMIDPLEREFPIGFYMTAGEKWTVAPVLLGLTPQEEVVTPVNIFLQGRWFLRGETGVCIINEHQAEELGMNVTDVFRPVEVEVENVPHTVIGVLKNDFELFKDLDGESVTPIQLDWPGTEINPYTVHVEMDYVLILP